MRRLPTYTAERLSDVIGMQRQINPGAHDELVADLAAIVLTRGSADDVAEVDAARQAREWLARNPVGAR